MGYKKQDASESKLALAKLKFQIEGCAFGSQGGWTPLEVQDYQRNGFSLGN